MKKASKVTIGSGAAILAVASILLLSFQSQAGITTLNIDVPTDEHYKGDIFDVFIMCNTTQPVKAWECKLRYDNNILNAIKVIEGSLFSGHTTFFNEGIIDNDQGSIINMYNLILGPGNVTGVRSIVAIRFQAVGVGQANISLYDVGVTNETMYLNMTFTDNIIFIYSIYDINTDRVIDLEDIIRVAMRYGENGTPGWIPEDVNNDGKIKLLDLVLVAINWGEY